jgi:hypothetical protein
MSRPAAHPQTGWRAGWTSLHTAWLLFAPPAVLVGVRWTLQLSTDRLTGAPALPLSPVSVPSGWLDLFWPAAVVVLVLVAGGLLLHRLGGRRAVPLLGLLWVLLWLGGSAALLQRHLNQQGLLLHEAAAPGNAPSPGSVLAQVLSSQFKPPSLRSMGGTALVLQVPGLQAPHRLLLDEPQAAQIKPGDTLLLAFSPGRFRGLFVTNWRVAPHMAPAQPVTTFPAAPAAPL